jgi:uncharacterized delta-60 repeat protein
MWQLPLLKKFRHRAKKTSRPTSRPRLEVLEDRCLLSGGALDPTFGSGGMVNPPSFEVRGMAIQTDGKIVTTGISFIPKNPYDKFGVVRYNSNGSLDTSFGTGGKTTTSIGNYQDDPNAVFLQPDGKILVAGTSLHYKGYTGNGDMALVRYNANGSLDTTFGTKGMLTTTFSKDSSDFGTAVTELADGRIVLAGSVSDSAGVDFELVRLSAVGALDTTFGTGGRVWIHFPSMSVNGSLVKVVVQTDGKMVVSGNAWGASVSYAALARLNVNGTLDASFASGGEAVAQVSDTNSHFGGLALQTDGKLVMAGQSFTPAGQSNVMTLVRFNSNGSLDSAFASNGLLTVTSNSPYWDAGLNDVAIAGDGKIIAAGFSHHDGGSSSDKDITMIRVNALDGSLDATFGSGGIVYTAITSGADVANAMALQSDGKIVLAGTVLARYLPSSPQVGSMTASSNPVAAGNPVTLTAGNITDANPGAAITQVAFYVDSNGDGKLDSTTDTLLGYATQTSPGVWTFTFTVSLAPGTYKLFAQAEDSYGVFSDPIALNLQVL